MELGRHENKFFICMFVLFYHVKLHKGDCGLMDNSYFLTPDLISIRYINKNTETGSEAILSCPPGYILKGTPRVQCDGDWLMPSKPKCIKISCPIPEEVPNGKIYIANQYHMSKVSFGTAYSVHCDQGFTLKGDNVRTCLDSGLWSGRRPQCIEFQPNCDLPTHVKNGKTQLITNPKFKTHPQNQTFFLVICDFEYRLNGSPLVVCDANGQLLTNMPQCLPNKMCSALPHDINNGRLKPIIKDELYYIECDHGYDYTGDGSPFVICDNTGIWSVESPYCKQIPQEDYGIENLVVACVLIIFLLAWCGILMIRKISKKAPAATLIDDTTK